MRYVRVIGRSPQSPALHGARTVEIADAAVIKELHKNNTKRETHSVADRVSSWRDSIFARWTHALHCQNSRPKAVARSEVGLYGIAGPTALTHRRLMQLLECSRRRAAHWVALGESCAVRLHFTSRTSRRTPWQLA